MILHDQACAIFRAFSLPTSARSPRSSKQSLQGIPNSDIGLRFAELNFFINENWRVRPNFSLDLGLRYEYNSGPERGERSD